MPIKIRIRKKPVDIVIKVTRKKYMDRDYFARQMYGRSEGYSSSRAFMETSPFISKMSEINNIDINDKNTYFIDEKHKVNTLVKSGNNNTEYKAKIKETAEKPLGNTEDVEEKSEIKPENDDIYLGYLNSSRFGLGENILGDKRIFDEEGAKGEDSKISDVFLSMLSDEGRKMLETINGIASVLPDGSASETDEGQKNFVTDDENFDEDDDMDYYGDDEDDEDDEDELQDYIGDAYRNNEVSRKAINDLVKYAKFRNPGMTPGIIDDSSYTLKTRGLLSVFSGVIKIEYDESEITGIPNSFMSVTFDKKSPEIVTLTKKSFMRTDFSLEQGKRHHCVTTNGIFNVQISATAYKQKNSITEKGGEYSVDFLLEANGSPTDMIEYSMSVFV